MVFLSIIIDVDALKAINIAVNYLELARRKKIFPLLCLKCDSQDSQNLKFIESSKTWQIGFQECCSDMAWKKTANRLTQHLPVKTKQIFSIPISENICLECSTNTSHLFVATNQLEFEEQIIHHTFYLLKLQCFRSI